MLPAKLPTLQMLIQEGGLHLRLYEPSQNVNTRSFSEKSARFVKMPVRTNPSACEWRTWSTTGHSLKGNLGHEYHQQSTKVFLRETEQFSCEDENLLWNQHNFVVKYLGTISDKALRPLLASPRRLVIFLCKIDKKKTLTKQSVMLLITIARERK